MMPVVISVSCCLRTHSMLFFLCPKLEGVWRSVQVWNQKSLRRMTSFVDLVGCILWKTGNRICLLWLFGQCGREEMSCGSGKAANISLIWCSKLGPDCRIFCCIIQQLRHLWDELNHNGSPQRTNSTR